ncbi:hypothetical protein [Kribbella sp. VKM Ac-2569]|uniref:hypothetical protein n=1 Tax=Kribbella sp. VKM Ac-2569 TaxID=2512220 RepID=UPI0018E4FD74|nr:hypothetical protein [Kribbella sp. VKM Ac-2569]
MFVACAAVAYSYGITVYVWWAMTIGVGVGIGAFLFAARWNRLRAKHGVVSPLEYLARRYNLPTQQALAYSGAALKVVDIASKWVAIAVLARFRFCRLGEVTSSPVAIAKQPAVAGPAVTAAGRAVAVRGAFLRSQARL